LGEETEEEASGEETLGFSVRTAGIILLFFRKVSWMLIDQSIFSLFDEDFSL